MQSLASRSIYIIKIVFSGSKINSIKYEANTTTVIYLQFFGRRVNVIKSNLIPYWNGPTRSIKWHTSLSFKVSFLSLSLLNIIGCGCVKTNGLRKYILEAFVHEHTIFSFIFVNVNIWQNIAISQLLNYDIPVYSYYLFWYFESRL